MSFWGREAASWQQLCQPLGALDEGASVGRCRAPAVLPELGKESFHWKYSTMGGILAQNPWFSFMRTAVNFCREHQHLESNFPEINPFWQVLFSLFLVTAAVIIQIFERLWACSSPLELQLCSWTRLFSSYPAWNSWVGWEELCSLWSSSAFLKPSFLQLQWTISVQQVPRAELKTLWFAESEWKPGSTNGALSGGSVPSKPALAWPGIHPY